MATGDTYCANGDNDYLEWVTWATPLADPTGETFARINRVDNYNVSESADIPKKAHSDSSGVKVAGCGTTEFTITFTARVQEGTDFPFGVGSKICLKETSTTGKNYYYPVTVTGRERGVDYDSSEDVTYDITAESAGPLTVETPV